MTKYSMDNIKLWAEEYKKCYSFSEVGRIFNVDKGTIKRNLIKNKIKFNIKTRHDLSYKGLRRCSKCKKIKLLKSFVAHWQKSRCKECVKKMGTEYRKDNLEKCLTTERKWYHKNKKKKAEYKKKYRSIQKDNPEYKLKKRLRGRLREAIKNRKKIGSAVKDLGCTVRELKNYLEEQFYINTGTDEKMTWENYGFNGWHIDHIIPLASFNLENREQFLEACNYTNLQPLWSKDHKRKTTKDAVIIRQSQKK